MTGFPPPAELPAAVTPDPWPERRRRFAETHPKRCAVCSIPDCDLHHRRYDSPRGQEPDHDLEWLCKQHHRQVHRWHDRLAPRDVRPYRWLSFVTTLAIVVLRVHLFVRRPAIVAALTTAAYWWAGLWLPVLVLAVWAAGYLLRHQHT